MLGQKVGLFLAVLPNNFDGNILHAANAWGASHSLAYAQARLILARLIYSFDMSLAQPNEQWLDNRHQIIWAKKPLNVHLTRAVQDPEDILLM